MLDLLYYRTADRINKLRLKDYQKRERKLKKSAGNEDRRKRLLSQSCEYQKGLVHALNQLRSECARMTRDLKREAKQDL